MFDFFSKTFSQLKERLAETELKHLHKIVKLVLTNFDYKYLNFIGELATLNAYKSTDEYNLLNIEERIYDHNNVQADLFLRRKLDNKEFLVEIVNIHIENRQLNKKVQIEKFVNGKINEKVEKTFFDNPKQELFLQPVIWIESFEQIKILAKIFRKRNRKNIFIPMCYLTCKNRDGTFEHRFEYVNTILTEEF